MKTVPVDFEESLVLMVVFNSKLAAAIGICGTGHVQDYISAR